MRILSCNLAGGPFEPDIVSGLKIYTEIFKHYGKCENIRIALFYNELPAPVLKGHYGIALHSSAKMYF